jgi:two-component system sensor histidine kinase AlgZ
MHPIFRNWKLLLLYLAAWIPIGAILGFLVSVAGNLNALEAAAVAIPVIVILAFVSLSPWYICRSKPLRAESAAGLLGQHVLAAIIVAGAITLVARLAASALSSFLPGLNQRFAAAVPILTVVVAMIYMLSIALHYVAIEVQASRRSELLAREAQLKALKAQVNPHFLFNSLNSISALTAIDATRAREMCVRLADFLRVSLRLGERATITFREELELTKMYLGVEQVRFGNRLRLAQDVDASCAEFEIPALLIQPLVENAVKHGIALLDEGGEILISGHVNGNMLRFMIENPFDPEAPPGRSGIGLANVRERLEARYGGAARMEVEAGDRRYRVTLTLPVRDAH